MNKNVLVQVGTIEYQEEVVIPATYDEDGNELSPECVETVTKTRPDMQPMNVGFTPEEEAEALAQQAKWEEWERNRPRTPEERCDAVEVKQSATEQDVNMLADTVLALCDIIEGGEQ